MSVDGWSMSQIPLRARKPGSRDTTMYCDDSAMPSTVHAAAPPTTQSAARRAARPATAIGGTARHKSQPTTSASGSVVHGRWMPSEIV